MHRSVQNRYAVLAFGTFTFTCVGIIYGWSKFSAAIRADLALNHAQITLAYTISIAMFSLGIALDGLLSRLCSVKTSVTAACLMTAAAFWFPPSSPLAAGFALYAVYGLLVGLGMGIIYGGWLSNIRCGSGGAASPRACCSPQSAFPASRSLQCLLPLPRRTAGASLSV